MAIISILRRRTSLSLSSILNHHHPTSLSSSSPFSQFSSPNPNLIIPNIVSHFRAFRSSNVLFARPRTSYNDNDNDIKIGPDDILFEGCDYNHWLITMDFPKENNKPSPEEMVETYVQTAAKVLGSVEEAKKKMYACSTTTYNGFQVEVSEEVSNKFQGLPGVVFVLPDSYVDPLNKQYGGDKYDNGIITPRPPPIQHGRVGSRFGDRNRDFVRPTRPRGEHQQGNPPYGVRGPTQMSAGNFGPPQNPLPQQNAPPRGAPVNYTAGGQENYQGHMRDQMHPNQGNHIQGQRVNSYPQGQEVPSGELNNNAPPQGGNFRQGAGSSYGQGAGNSYGQGGGGSYGAGASGSYGQGGGGDSFGQGGGGGNYGQGGGGGNYGQGGGGGNYRQGGGGGGNYGQGGGGGNYGQGGGVNYGQGGGGSYSQGAGGSYGQGTTGGYGQGVTGSFGQGTCGNVPGQEKFPNYGQDNSAHGGNQRFSQGEQMNDLRQVQH